VLGTRPSVGMHDESQGGRRNVSHSKGIDVLLGAGDCGHRSVCSCRYAHTDAKADARPGETDRNSHDAS
jgi:hypothetical protein